MLHIFKHILIAALLAQASFAQSPVSCSVVLEASWKEAGGLIPAPMLSSREKSVYQSSVQWMLAALVFSSS